MIGDMRSVLRERDGKCSGPIHYLIVSEKTCAAADVYDAVKLSLGLSGPVSQPRSGASESPMTRYNKLIVDPLLAPCEPPWMPSRPLEASLAIARPGYDSQSSVGRSSRKVDRVSVRPQHE